MGRFDGEPQGRLNACKVVGALRRALQVHADRPFNWVYRSGASFPGSHFEWDQSGETEKRFDTHKLALIDIG